MCTPDTIPLSRPARVDLKRCWRTASLLLALVGALALPGCAKMVASSLGDALASESVVYAGDDDVALVGAAIPFGLKTMESVLEQVPEHRPLLTATARGFTQFAYVYVQLPADELEALDVAAAYDERTRARRLYLRARDYGLRALGFDDRPTRERLYAAPGEALAETTLDDVAALYWTAIAWSAAISLGKDHAALIADLPIVDAMVARASMLDADFDDGGLHTFLIAYEMARPGGGRETEAIARSHFRRALALTGGERVAPYVAMAESVSLPRGERREFTELLEQALAVDADARIEWRLANHVMQQRARWLLANVDTYFLE